MHLLARMRTLLLVRTLRTPDNTRDTSFPTYIRPTARTLVACHTWFRVRAAISTHGRLGARGATVTRHFAVPAHDRRSARTWRDARYRSEVGAHDAVDSAGATRALVRRRRRGRRDAR